MIEEKHKIDKLNLNEKTYIATLCKGHGCCPELHINVQEKDSYILTDDYGGYVKLTTEELHILLDIVKDMI